MSVKSDRRHTKRLTYKPAIGTYGQFTPMTPTQLNSTQLLSQASKQRVVCAQQRDVTMLMTSAHCHPKSPQLGRVGLSCVGNLILHL